MRFTERVFFRVKTLHCPSWAEVFPGSPPDNHYELYSSIDDTRFHVAWEGTWGFTDSWYCPECQPESLNDVNLVHIPYSESWWDEVETLRNHTGEQPPLHYFAMLWFFEDYERVTDSDVVVPDVEVAEEDVTYYDLSADEGSQQKTRVEQRYQTTEDTTWDVDLDALGDRLRDPTEWRRYLNGVQEDVLLACDLEEVAVRLGDGSSASELVVRAPSVLDREERSYPWRSE